MEAMAPALAGGFFTTEPSGKSTQNYKWYRQRSKTNFVRWELQCVGWNIYNTWVDTINSILHSAEEKSEFKDIIIETK